MRKLNVGFQGPWRMWPAGVLVVLLGCAVLGAFAIEVEDPPSTASATMPEADPFLALNAEFRTIYRAARAETLARTSPIVLVSGDAMVLWANGQREEVRVIPDAYHRFKVVAHLPLALYLALGIEEGEALTPETKLALERLRERALEVQTALDGHDWTPAQRDRQERLIASSLELLDEAIERQRVDRGRRLAFARAMGPLLLANVTDAVQLALDAYDAQVSAWQAELTPEDWERLRVIVQGGPMPRRENLAIQYFSRRLGLPGECERLVYAESIQDEAQALDLLATHRLDRAFSGDFFGDPTIMERDLQATATTEYLHQFSFGP